MKLTDRRRYEMLTRVREFGVNFGHLLPESTLAVWRRDRRVVYPYRSRKAVATPAPTPIVSEPPAPEPVAPKSPDTAQSWPESADPIAPAA